VRVSVGIGACRLQSGGCSLSAVDGLIVLLLRDFLLVDQHLVAEKIVLRFRIVGFRFRDLRFGGFKLLTRGLDSSLRAGNAALCAADLTGSAHIGDRDVNAGGGSLRLRVGVFSARLRHGDFVIGGVDFHQHCSFSTYWLSCTLSLITWPLTRALTAFTCPSICASSVDS